MSDPIPAVFPPPRAELRPVEHPDMSAFVTHFCHRGRAQAIPPSIASLDARHRLEAILWEGGLRAFTTWGGGDPAACFTEATVHGLEFLIGQRSYAPWALVFSWQSVYDAGGGPVWYPREEEYDQIRLLDSRMRAWAVRLEAGFSDWLEEREWRIPVSPVDGFEPFVPLLGLELVAVLVGDVSWSPVRTVLDLDPPNGSTGLSAASSEHAARDPPLVLGLHTEPARKHSAARIARHSCHPVAQDTEYVVDTLLDDPRSACRMD